ncbi:MAG TPA: hypothetical protein VFE62_29670 [Gemmataceae bacterium]|nr:hypothetical protein [Gemmataceae bacterium]
MSTTPVMAPPLTTPKPRKRRWLRVLLALLALAILMPLGVIGYWIIGMPGAWTQAEEEAAQEDPRWRLQDMQADRPVIADADNSALKMMAMVRGGRVWVSGVPNYDLMFEKLPANSQLNSQQVQVIQTEFAKMPKQLEQARELRKYPEGRFPVTFTDDWISTVIQHHQDARTVADWLKHDAMLRAQEGDYDGAVESCQAIINGGRAMKDDPFLITVLIRIAMQNIALDSLERALAQGEASEERLREMQAMLEKEIEQSSFLIGMRGERAGHHYLFESIRDGKVKPRLMSMISGGSVGIDSFDDWLSDNVPSTMLKHYPDHLHNMNQMVAASKLPLHERGPTLTKIFREGRNSGNRVSKVLMPATDKVEKADRRSQMQLRAMVVALACERYRMKHEEKRWPVTLDDLIKAKLLSAFPTDPIDNQPLRYRQVKEGIVVYSLGFDEQDNQGNIQRDRHLDPGVDLGYRLWNLDQRRLPPLPPVGLPDPALGPMPR